MWQAFLQSLWPDDLQSVESLQEWFGYLLLPDTRQHKLLILIGPPRSGKGTIARVLKGVIGERSLASPTLSSLAGPFGLWPLNGKTVALIPEARLGRNADAIAVVERLLSISGEDPQDVHRKNLPTDSRKVFKSAQDEVAPQLKQADSGPYRNVQVYPPVTYRDVDEVDVQFQAEQITVPNWHMHAVDFEKRPDKPAWFHPEVWNDQGTGEQILPVLFQIAMRGGDDVGSSGWVPNWGTQPFDSRSGYHGLASIMRAAGELFHEHGPWLLKTKKNDRVAIIVSPRLIKIDNWHDFSGLYFSRLFEAYQSCLYAHRPASIVFLDDLDADGLKKYQAVLVVGQTVEMEPKLAEALRVAKDAGVAVFADGSCRAELVADLQPLGVSFNQIEKLHSINNDFAYWEHPRLLKEHAAVLREKLASIVFPVAECDNPEVTLTERLSTSHDGVRYVFAANNTTTTVEPGSLWKMTLGIATRLPIKTMLGLRDLEGCSMYDLFDGRQVQPDTAGRIECDLRTLPMRVYAIVPGQAKPAIESMISARPSLKVAPHFGPHLKDIAIAGDVAVLNAFNWDNNLYGLDINNGQIKWCDRVGHYFAFAPQSTGNGFAVQGQNCPANDSAGRLKMLFVNGLR